MKARPTVKKQVSSTTWTFIFLLISVAVIELLCASLFWGQMDLVGYNFKWAQVAASHWGEMYRPRFENGYLVNYPPLIPTLLWPIGKIVNHFGLSLVGQSGLRTAVAYALIKLIPLIFHWLTACFLYWKSTDKANGLTLGIFVLVNPALWFNAAFWGQLDTVLIFMVVISFYYFSKGQYWLASIWFAIGCLAKLQFIYLVPIYGLALLVQLKWRQVISHVAVIAGINLVGWAPFMITMKNVFLPIKIFTSGASQYDNIHANAFNFWSAILKARVWYKQLTTSDHLLGSLTYGQLNQIILFVIVVGLVVAFCWLFRKGTQNVSLALIGMVYSGLIFFFTMGQHERYQMTMLAFALLLLMPNQHGLTKNMRYWWNGVLTVAIFINEAFVYLAIYFHLGLQLSYQLIRVGGVINTLVFLLMLGLTFRSLKLNGGVSYGQH